MNLHEQEWINTARPVERFRLVDAKHGRRVDDAEDWTERPTRIGQSRRLRYPQRALNVLAVTVGLYAIAIVAMRTVLAGQLSAQLRWFEAVGTLFLVIPAMIAATISMVSVDRNRSWWHTGIATVLTAVFVILRLRFGLAEPDVSPG